MHRSVSLLALVLLPACSGASGDGSMMDPEIGTSTGGASATGGMSTTGGANTGGTPTGGNPSGGNPAAGGTSSGGANSTGGATGFEDCSTPSIDRLQQWLAAGEGPTLPATGSLLASEGDGYVARATFTSASEWHVLAIWLGNQFGASIDLTGSTGFTLTYSATSDFYFQLRPAAQWSGGDKWHVAIPSTDGGVVTSFFPFEGWVERLGTPPHTFAEALQDASGFTVVGNSQNELEFFGLVVDGYEPPCLD